MSHNSIVFFRFWLPVILWMAAIFALSSVPGEEMPNIDIPYIDKFIHFAEYLVLGILLIRAFLNSNLTAGIAPLIMISILAASLYAISDEIHQRFVSGRTPDVFDLVSDFIGSCAGIFLYDMRRKACRQ